MLKELHADRSDEGEDTEDVDVDGYCATSLNDEFESLIA